MNDEKPLSPITKSKVLIVEGEEEIRVFSELIAHLNLPDIEIRDIGGKTKFRTNVRTLMITPGFHNVTSVGVIRDADDNPASAFQSVCDALQSAGFAKPTKTLQPVGDSPQVVVMILPDGETPGMLEDLCLKSVEEDPAIRCLDEYFECLQERLGRLPSNLSKARVHAFLASRERPDLRLGEAAQKGHWPWGHPAFEQVRQFLNAL
jgi:hypothetical protein